MIFISIISKKQISYGKDITQYSFSRILPCVIRLNRQLSIIRHNQNLRFHMVIELDNNIKMEVIND